MRKEIFESDEADDFIAEIILPQFPISEITSELRDCFKRRMEENGLIKKTPVDEADEMYERYERYHEIFIDSETINMILDKQHEAIQYLKYKLKDNK